MRTKNALQDSLYHLVLVFFSLLRSCALDHLRSPIGMKMSHLDCVVVTNSCNKFIIALMELSYHLGMLSIAQPFDIKCTIIKVSLP